MIDLSGKTILLTGGSRGIGAVTARVLSKAGANLILHYGSSQKQAEEVAGGLSNCHLVQADLSKPESASRLWLEATKWKGQIDILVNNAAIAPYAAVEDSLELWHSTWAQTTQVNLFALADLCREAILHFRARGGGTIINVASRAAFRGDNPNMMHYAASKGAVVSLTKSIARGFAKEGILAVVAQLRMARARSRL